MSCHPGGDWHPGYWVGGRSKDTCFFDPTSRLVMLECGGTCSCRHWRRRDNMGKYCVGFIRGGV